MEFNRLLDFTQPMSYKQEEKTHPDIVLTNKPNICFEYLLKHNPWVNMLLRAAIHSWSQLLIMNHSVWDYDSSRSSWLDYGIKALFWLLHPCTCTVVSPWPETVHSHMNGLAAKHLTEKQNVRKSHTTAASLAFVGSKQIQYIWNVWSVHSLNAAYYSFWNRTGKAMKFIRTNLCHLFSQPNLYCSQEDDAH